MKRVGILLLVALAGCKKSTEATVKVHGTTFPVQIIRTRTAFRDFLARWSPQRYAVAYPDPRHHHYESRDHGYDVVFTDASGKVLESIRLDAGAEGGITSSVEATHAIFFPTSAEHPSIAPGDTVELSTPLRENLPPLLAALSVNGQAVRAQTAVTKEDQEHGLMYWTRLSQGDGMLFVYERPEPHGFWMSNCAIDLDIAFFRSDGTLINVVEMDRYPDPKKDPGTRARSREAAQYVLEVNQGWFRSRGLIREDGSPNGSVRMTIPPDVGQ